MLFVIYFDTQLQWAARDRGVKKKNQLFIQVGSYMVVKGKHKKNNI